MPYDSGYESSLLRGIEEHRPWNLLETIRDFTKESDFLLDIGCGTASKLLYFVYDVKQMYGLELNKKMIDKALENIRKAGISNILLVNGQVEKLPFVNNSFDVVTCMVAPHDIHEVYRVLKPGGVAVLEKTGDRDKWNFKQELGLDAHGLRGQFANLAEGDLEIRYGSECRNLFSEVSIRKGFWKTYYSIEGLILLLEQTPTIRNFDKALDASVLERIEANYSTSLGIETTQNRLLIIARK